DNLYFFFFQAEDGIRDRNVTGVQTCALPISRRSMSPAATSAVPPMPGTALVAAGLMLLLGVAEVLDPAARRLVIGVRFGGLAMEIGRASCRERGDIWDVDGSYKEKSNRDAVV